MGKDLVGALKVINSRLKGRRFRWMFMGSVSLYLHGIVKTVGDIDILTDKKGAYRICGLLEEYVVKPPVFSQTDLFKSHFGILKIKGMKVEIAGDFSEKAQDKWIALSRRRLNHPEYRRVEGMRLPVTPLKMHLESYKILNRRKDREKIRKLEEKLGRK